MSKLAGGLICAGFFLAVIYASCVGMAFADHLNDQPHDWFLGVNIFLLGAGSLVACVFSVFACVGCFTYAFEKEKRP